jgi:hypothetical protein
MLVVRVTENVRAVQSSYYSSCPWLSIRNKNLTLSMWLELARSLLSILISYFNVALYPSLSPHVRSFTAIMGGASCSPHCAPEKKRFFNETAVNYFYCCDSLRLIVIWNDLAVTIMPEEKKQQKRPHHQQPRERPVSQVQPLPPQTQPRPQRPTSLYDNSKQQRPLKLVGMKRLLKSLFYTWCIPLIVDQDILYIKIALELVWPQSDYK